MLTSNKTKILESLIKNSALWNKFKILKLDINVRANEDENYAEWLLKLGNNSFEENDELPDNYVKITDQMVLKNDEINN